MNGISSESQSLPRGFRKLGATERRTVWEARFLVGNDERDAAATGDAALELADLMVECAVGTLALPLGIAQGFTIDGIRMDVPMSVEEPSVIAAAGYAAHIISKGGGFQTDADEPVMETCVYLENVSAAGEERLRRSDPLVMHVLSPLQASLEKRGGGYRKLRVDRLAETGLVAVALSIDVRDAMGANILNTAAEAVTPLFEELSGGKALMGILSNAAEQRMARASFSLPFELLEPYCGEYAPDEIARRIELAYRVADEDPRRAVTHNKGIMNGIAALTQATMNDTRAVEAAAHAWSARTGRVRPLSRFIVKNGTLEGSIELPLALGTVGGSVDMHPTARACLRLLGEPDARQLARIAAALGLAQNFAALLALVSGGIQRGHMRLHAARLAYKAGARGEDTRMVAELMGKTGKYTMSAAKEAIKNMALQADRKA